MLSRRTTNSGEKSVPDAGGATVMQRSRLAEAYARLTRREKDVLAWVAEGKAARKSVRSSLPAR